MDGFIPYAWLLHGLCLFLLICLGAGWYYLFSAIYPPPTWPHILGGRVSSPSYPLDLSFAMGLLWVWMEVMTASLEQGF